MIQLELDEPTLDNQTKACLRLWSAALHRGMVDAAKAFAKGDQHDEALVWFWSDSQTPGSFCWICDVLGYEPDTVRGYTRMKFRELWQRYRREEEKSDSSDT